VAPLLAEIGLRLAKVVAASLIALVVYGLLVGPIGAPASAELALLAWLVGAATILLVESSPI
jgi:hypothetical protein